METDSITKKEILRKQNEELIDNISDAIESLENWRAEIESHIEEINEMKEEDITEEQMEEKERGYSYSKDFLDKINETLLGY